MYSSCLTFNLLSSSVEEEWQKHNIATAHGATWWTTSAGKLKTKMSTVHMLELVSYSSACLLMRMCGWTMLCQFLVWLVLYPAAFQLNQTTFWTSHSSCIFCLISGACWQFACSLLIGHQAYSRDVFVASPPVSQLAKNHVSFVE